ncbi:hypothetical protein DPMN_166445 [Dreissena polymorpha]|uniref:Uncharacterized protein n=1 Tax=Dreissena polymorpha TaxID=45954 RepID=A0A9D4EYZ6_DREPO|nr:hypothetical protein DPMN_166445 [Dreissena polymorpha]
MEKKLSHKIHNVIDTRFKKEQLKNKQEMEKEVHTLKDEFSSDIACLQSQVHDINSKPQICRDLNVCIMNHAQTSNENVTQIVKDLLVDGLKLRHVDFRKAERKASKDSKPGVIVVTFYTNEDRDSVLKNKSMLGDYLKYENVFISIDQSSETRNVNNNFKLLIARLGLSDLKLRGSRIIVEDGNNNQPSNTAGQRRPADGDSRRVKPGHNNPGRNSGVRNSIPRSNGLNFNTNRWHSNPRSSCNNQSSNQNHSHPSNSRADYDRSHSSRFNNDRYNHRENRNNYDYRYRDHRENHENRESRDGLRRDYDGPDPRVYEDRRNYRHNLDRRNSDSSYQQYKYISYCFGMSWDGLMMSYLRFFLFCEQCIESLKLDIVCIAESHLLNNHLNLENYVFYGNCRKLQ